MENCLSDGEWVSQTEGKAVGIQNHTSFHNAVVERKAEKTIRKVQCRDGTLVSSGKEIKVEVGGTFESFYNLNQRL